MNTESGYEKGREACIVGESPWENLATTRIEKGLSVEDVARYFENY